MKLHQSAQLGTALLVGALISSFIPTFRLLAASLSVVFLGSAVFTGHRLIQQHTTKGDFSSYAFRDVSTFEYIIALAACLIGGVALSYVAGHPFAKLVLAGAGLALVYSISLKQVPIAGTALKSALFASPYLAGAYIQGHITAPIALLTLSTACLLFGYFTLKNMDESQERRDMLALYGPRTTRLIVSAVVAIGVFSLALPYWATGAGTYYTIGILPAAILGVYSTLEPDPSRAKWFVLLAIYCIAAGFLLDALV